jgi:hypothetical protein
LSLGSNSELKVVQHDASSQQTLLGHHYLWAQTSAAGISDFEYVLRESGKQFALLSRVQYAGDELWHCQTCGR